MSTRKIFLLSGIAVLAVAFAVQTALAARDPVKTLKLADKESPDAISIALPGGDKIDLSKSGEAWTIGDKKYPADGAKIASMVDAIMTVKSLGVVSGSNDYDRYGLGDAAKISVTATKSGKTVRTLGIGKNSTAYGQTFALIDGKTSVTLVSGSLGDVFGGGVETLRDHNIWALKRDDVTSVAVKAAGKDASFTIEQTGDPAAWKLTAPESAKSFALDADAAAAWASGFSALRAESFAPEGTAIPESALAEFAVTAAGKEVRLTVYAKEAVPGKADQFRYLCVASESPYPFYLSAAAAEKYLAPYAALAKK